MMTLKAIIMKKKNNKNNNDRNQENKGNDKDKNDNEKNETAPITLKPDDDDIFAFDTTLIDKENLEDRPFTITLFGNKHFVYYDITNKVFYKNEEDYDVKEILGYHGTLSNKFVQQKNFVYKNFRYGKAVYCFPNITGDYEYVMVLKGKSIYLTFKNYLLFRNYTKHDFIQLEQIDDEDAEETKYDLSNHKKRCKCAKCSQKPFNSILKFNIEKNKEEIFQIKEKIEETNRFKIENEQNFFNEKQNKTESSYLNSASSKIKARFKDFILGTLEHFDNGNVWILSTLDNILVSKM